MKFSSLTLSLLCGSTFFGGFEQAELEERTSLPVGSFWQTTSCSRAGLECVRESRFLVECCSYRCCCWCTAQNPNTSSSSSTILFGRSLPRHHLFSIGRDRGRAIDEAAIIKAAVCSESSLRAALVGIQSVYTTRII